MSETTHDVPINLARIRELVPHAGKMCLLERIVACDSAFIRCETRSHLDRGNPLRRNGHLSSVCAIEYAAQAMALHGALTAPGHNGALTAPGGNGALSAQGRIGQSSAAALGSATEGVRHGYLASVREMHCRARYLDRYPDELIVSVRLIFDESSRMIYSFTVAAGETELVTGRAAIVLV